MYVYPYVCICMCLCLIVHVRPYCSSACAPLYYYSGFFQQDLFHPFQSLPGPEWPRVSRALLPLHTCFLFKPDFPTLAPPPLTHNLFSLPLFSAFNLSIWRVRTLFSLSLPLSPLCVCVCVCVCVCGCLTDSHLCAPTLSPSRSLSLSPSVVFSLKLTHTLYRSISYCLSLAHAHSLSPSLPLSLTRSISRSLSRTPFPVRSVLGNNETLTESTY